MQASAIDGKLEPFCSSQRRRPVITSISGGGNDGWDRRKGCPGPVHCLLISSAPNETVAVLSHPSTGLNTLSSECYNRQERVVQLQYPSEEPEDSLLY